MKTKKIPAKACNLKILDADLQFGDNGEDSKTAPIKMIARSAEPIAHWWFGSVIHDLSGMHLLKDRVVIDWLHSDDIQLGYLNKFEVTEEGLEVSGALVPYKDDKATEIINKQKGGVPYEASIDFRPRGSFGLKIEEVGEGIETEVNGKTYTGPIVVIREWPLNAVAICPHGADDRTAAFLNAEDDENEVEIQIMKTEDKKAVEGSEEAKAAQLKADAAKVEADKVEKARVDAEGEALAAAKLAAEKTGDEEKTDERTQFAKFVTAFGDKAQEYFADGLSLEDAQAKFTAEVVKENEKLKAKMSRAKVENDAVSFEADDDDGKCHLSAGDEKRVREIAENCGRDPDKAVEREVAQMSA